VRVTIGLTAWRARFDGTAFGSHNADSFLGGVQVGCDYQIGGWVFRFQGDYD
jgi:hypothetical protein